MKPASADNTPQHETAPAPAETRLVGFPGGRSDLDHTAEGVAGMALTAGQPVRLRIQPALFLPGGGGRYLGWRGVFWKMEFASFEDLRQFREDLSAFVAGWFQERKR